MMPGVSWLSLIEVYSCLSVTTPLEFVGKRVIAGNQSYCERRSRDDFSYQSLIFCGAGVSGLNIYH